MRSKNLIVTFLLLIAIWLMLTSTFDPSMVITGVIVAGLVSLLFARKSDLFTELHLSPKAMIYTILYIFVFIGELVKSNLDVAWRVLSPTLPIRPGIVKVKTKLKSRMGRMILANSITLTPGTFTVEITDEFLYIHWIDVVTKDQEDPTEHIVRKFEKYLEVIYG
ncbi:MAG: Na+/H+ antiporter subunit E [Bacteroidales bacterium]|nr:Na+/H+ antiporter subunit E [Bacteroidales bacterium]